MDTSTVIIIIIIMVIFIILTAEYVKPLYSGGLKFSEKWFFKPVSFVWERNWFSAKLDAVFVCVRPL